MLNALIKVIIIIILLLGLAYGGITIISCANYGKVDGEIKMPSERRASHTIYFENTGGMILADDFIEDQAAGVITVNGYWEISGDRYVYKDNNITIDEAIFGPVTVKPRKER